MSHWRERYAGGGCLRIGHRGAAALAPQNTLQGFQKAIDLGVDAIELDVRRTSDGHLVVIHDEEVAHSTNGQGFVHDYTLADLRRLDAGEGQTVPTFAEALSFLKGKTLVVVDLKLIGHGYEEAVTRTILEYGMQEDSLVCTLLAGSLRRVRQLAPGIFTSFSYPEDAGGASNKPYLAWAVSLTLAYMRTTLPWRIGRMMSNAQADGVMLHHRLATRAVVQAVRRRGKFIGVWTVDAADNMARLRAMGVNSITSNRPDLL